MANKKSFEENMALLEDIVQRLEDGRLNLDEMIKLYEQGIKISKACEKQLTEGQLKLSALAKEGTIMREEPLSEDE